MDKININFCVSRESIENLLVSALEGGSNYWYLITKEIEPTDWEYFGDYNKEKTKYLQLYPLNHGGALMIDDSVEMGDDAIRPRKLDWNRIKKGLAVMAKNYPKQFAYVLNDDINGETADIFLQCCIFGKVIYG